jgi:hypothetical protein
MVLSRTYGLDRSRGSGDVSATHLRDRVVCSPAHASPVVEQMAGRRIARLATALAVPSNPAEVVQAPALGQQGAAGGAIGKTNAPRYQLLDGVEPFPISR